MVTSKKNEPTGAAGKPAKAAAKTTARGAAKPRAAAKPAAKTGARKAAAPAKAGAGAKAANPRAARRAAKAALPPKTPLPDDIAAEVGGLVAPEDSPATRPVPVQGVTRPVPQDADAARATKLARKDLIDRVVARSGAKPRVVRQVADALLQELGDMMAEVETLQIQPLGNLRVQRRKDVGDGEVVIVKLKRKKPTSGPNDPLAAAAE